MKCQSGEMTGEACGSGDDATVTIEWVPPQHRGTAKALGSDRGLTETLHLCDGCYSDVGDDNDASESAEWEIEEDSAVGPRIRYTDGAAIEEMEEGAAERGFSVDWTSEFMLQKGHYVAALVKP